jgi:hypothetical protein
MAVNVEEWCSSTFIYSQPSKTPLGFKWTKILMARRQQNMMERSESFVD